MIKNIASFILFFNIIFSGTFDYNFVPLKVAVQQLSIKNQPTMKTQSFNSVSKSQNKTLKASNKKVFFRRPTGKIALFVLFLLVFLYYIPAPKADFFKLYNKNDTYSKNMKFLLQQPMKKVVNKGITWKYYDYGKGEPAIVFLHGMGGSAEIWWNQILELGKNHRVIAYTLPDRVNSLEKAEKGIMNILDKENIHDFYLVGTSMGGYIAQYIMDKHPDRVKKAVFGNTFAPNNLISVKNGGKRKLLPLFPELLIWQLGKKQLSQIILPAAQNNKLLASILPSLSFSKKGFINRYDLVVDTFTPYPERKEIRNIPKMIIESDNDPLIDPVLRKQLKQLYDYARVYTFHDQGHFPYVSNVEEYNTILHDFLDASSAL